MEPIAGPEGIMVESMLIGMAEYYSAELALKVARGERENALQCKYIVPLGFTIGKEDRLYHIDPETAPSCRKIASRYADGEPAGEDRSIPERRRVCVASAPEAVREEQLLQIFGTAAGASTAIKTS